MLSLRAVRAPEDPVERTQMLADMLLAGEQQQQHDEGGDGASAGAAVVYVTLQRTAVEVAQALVAAGIDARPYHAGLPALQREVCVSYVGWRARRGRVAAVVVAAAVVAAVGFLHV